MSSLAFHLPCLHGAQSAWLTDVHTSSPVALLLPPAGDTTQNLLWRLQNGEGSAALAPKVAVMLVGTNDLTNPNYNLVRTGAACQGPAALLNLPCMSARTHHPPPIGANVRAPACRTLPDHALWQKRPAGDASAHARCWSLGQHPPCASAGPDKTPKGRP